MPENAEIMFCKIYYVEPSKLYNYNKYLLTAKHINRTENAKKCQKMPKMPKNAKKCQKCQKMPKNAEKCRKNAEKTPKKRRKTPKKRQKFYI